MSFEKVQSPGSTNIWIKKSESLRRTGKFWYIFHLPFNYHE